MLLHQRHHRNCPILCPVSLHLHPHQHGSTFTLPRLLVLLILQGTNILIPCHLPRILEFNQTDVFDNIDLWRDLLKEFFFSLQKKIKKKWNGKTQVMILLIPTDIWSKKRFRYDLHIVKYGVYFFFFWSQSSCVFWSRSFGPLRKHVLRVNFGPFHIL